MHFLEDFEIQQVNLSSVFWMQTRNVIITLNQAANSSLKLQVLIWLNLNAANRED